MIYILLVCSAGISTSTLVTRMQEAAEKKGVKANIWTVGDADSKDAAKRADIVLLGPQVRYLEEKMIKMVDKKIPVAVIDMRVYGAMNGDKALKSALKVLEDFNKQKALNID